MRLFQNSGIYAAYRPRLHRLSAGKTSFRERIDAFLDDRYGACHFLQPVLNRDSSAFFTNADDEGAQRTWAAEKGLPADSQPDDILLAQVEEHRTEVFYNMDPMRYPSSFVPRLPGCVRKTVTWRAAPSRGLDLTRYDRVVCNFPVLLDSYARLGWKPAFLAPAHDPEMDAYARNQDRPVDVAFVGGYSRHHRRRAEVLEAVAGLSPELRIEFHLDRSKLTRLAESPVGVLPPLRLHRRPAGVRRVSRPAVFGRSLYESLSQAQIVLNGAVDMAGQDRGNMRCFEAMGCGALMVTDAGRYPKGMVAGSTMETYRDAAHAVDIIRSRLIDRAGTRAMATAGHRMLHDHYSKAAQWQSFLAIVEQA